MVWVHQSDNSEIIFQVYAQRTFVFLFKRQFSTNTEKFSTYLYTFFTVEEAGMLLKFMSFFMCVYIVFKEQLRDGRVIKLTTQI